MGRLGTQAEAGAAEGCDVTAYMAIGDSLDLVKKLGARACEAAAEWLDAETRSEAEWQEETR